MRGDSNEQVVVDRRMFNSIAPRPFEFEERCVRSCLGVKFFARLRFGASNFFDTFAPGNNPLETGQPTNDAFATANPNLSTTKADHTNYNTASPPRVPHHIPRLYNCNIL